jgi:hypothetical protein
MTMQQPPYGPPADQAQPEGRRRLTLLGYVVVLVVALIIADQFYGGPGVTALLIFGVPILVAALVIRALVRIGDKRPPPVVLTQPPTAGPPPGWYPDPSGATGLRWFDGGRWTEFKQSV